MKSIAFLVILLVGCSRYEEETVKTQNGDNTQSCTPAPFCTQLDYDNGTCCVCQDGCCPNSPIVVDLTGNGLSLSSPEDGVRFALHPGRVGQWAWPLPGSAWLALPGEDGIVDDGTELFGNETPQDGDGPFNGFNALSRYDQPAYGGNGDGVIDGNDIVFDKLRLWEDGNPRDGQTQQSELVTLASVGIISLSLAAEVSEHVDEHGNQFRLKGDVTVDSNSTVGVTDSDVWVNQIPVTDEPQSCFVIVHCTAWAYAVSNQLDPNTGGNPPCSIPSVSNDPINTFGGHDYRFVQRYGTARNRPDSFAQASDNLFGAMNNGFGYCLFGPIRNPDPHMTEGFEVAGHGPIGSIPGFSYQFACSDDAPICTPPPGGGCGG